MTDPGTVDDARRAERNTHETLRVAIRDAALAKADRHIAEAAADANDAAAGLWREHRDNLRVALLIDYAVATAFDGGSDTTMAVVLRTDGMCAQHRTLGLLHQALTDVGNGA